MEFDVNKNDPILPLVIVVSSIAFFTIGVGLAVFSQFDTTFGDLATWFSGLVTLSTLLYVIHQNSKERLKTDLIQAIEDLEREHKHIFIKEKAFLVRKLSNNGKQTQQEFTRISECLNKVSDILVELRNPFRNYGTEEWKDPQQLVHELITQLMFILEFLHLSFNFDKEALVRVSGKGRTIFRLAYYQEDFNQIIRIAELFSSMCNIRLNFKRPMFNSNTNYFLWQEFLSSYYVGGYENTYDNKLCESVYLAASLVDDFCSPYLISNKKEGVINKQAIEIEIKRCILNSYQIDKITTSSKELRQSLSQIAKSISDAIERAKEEGLTIYPRIYFIQRRLDEHLDKMDGIKD
jgi:hypothetical protein